MVFNKQEFFEFAIHARVVGFYEEPVTLKSGQTSHWYANWRNAMDDVTTIQKLASYVLEFSRENGLHTDYIGVPEGATKLGLVTQLKSAEIMMEAPLPMFRAKPKEHGPPHDRYFLGKPRDGVCILEDVTTTGDSLIDVMRKTRDAGITIGSVVALTDRSYGQAQKKIYQEFGVPYSALSNADEIVTEAYRELKPNERIAQAVENEFDKNGISLTLA